MIENTDYFLAVGALIECERIRQKKLASDHKPFNQESFCKNIIKAMNCLIYIVKYP